MQPYYTIITHNDAKYCLEMGPPTIKPFEAPRQLFQIWGQAAVEQSKLVLDRASLAMCCYPVQEVAVDDVSRFKFGTDSLLNNPFHWIAYFKYDLANGECLFSQIMVFGASELAKASRGKMKPELDYRISERVKEVVAKGMDPKACHEYFDIFEALAKELGHGIATQQR